MAGKEPGMTVHDWETAQIDRANATIRTPVVFVHGLWLLPSSWQIADQAGLLIGKLCRKPAVIGHSFGGLLTQILAGRGLSAVSVAVDPAPFRGVLPLPLSALRAAGPILDNPANVHRAVPLTYQQFRYAIANAVSEQEAQDLYHVFAVPGSGAPVFQVGTANLNPWTEARVDTRNPPALCAPLHLSERKTRPWFGAPLQLHPRERRTRHV